MATSSGVKTRADSHVWLIGEPQNTFTGNKLPTTGEVLTVLMYHHNELNQSIRESVIDVSGKVLLIWNHAHIPTAETRNVHTKLEKVFETWKLLKKNSNRQTPTQIENEQKFTHKSKTLFDVAHVQAETIIRNPDDLAFLIDQRTERKAYMSGIDRKHDRMEASRNKRRESFERRQVQEYKRVLQQPSTSSISNSDTILNDTINEVDTDTEYELPKHVKRRKIDKTPLKTPLKKVITPELASALDRTKVTNRQATYIIAATAKSLGHDLTSLVVNKTSIARARNDNRRNVSQEIRQNFPVKSDILVVHWDGKLMNEITGGSGKVERLPILVTGDGSEKLLNVPKLPNSTGQSQAHAVLEAIKDWNLTDRIKAMGFDTTASNTGGTNGACKLIETELGRCLLALACRHHVFELVIGAAYNVSLKTPSSGPDIPLFKRFCEQWPYVNRDDFDTAYNDPYCSTIIQGDYKDKVDDVIGFCMLEVDKPQIRDDYREFLELTIIFLGHTPPRGIHFNKPGAYHHARWMAKILYAMKISMFKRQFTLRKREELGLRDFNLFAALIYTKAWFTAPAAISAPSNDLRLLKELDQYKSVNESISDATTNKFMGHLWYVSEVNVGLAFFANSCDVTDEVKSRMVESLEVGGSTPPKKRRTIAREDIPSLHIENCVTRNTKEFFSILGIPRNFLSSPPNQWEGIKEYQETKATLQKLKIVNDVAERGVALIQEYNSILTKDENQKQYLLQVVEKNRQSFPDSRKQTLVSGLNNDSK